MDFIDFKEVFVVHEIVRVVIGGGVVDLGTGVVIALV